MPPENILPAEFELHLDFARGTADPQRVFRTLTRVLEVLGTLDDTLVRLLDAELSTELALQDVQAGSIRTRIAIWLKPLVTGDLGQAIKEGNVKKIIGGFINKTLLFIVRYLENRQGLDTPEELRYL